ncbi:MAG: hypothetical protein IH861_09780 [Chloroflexi bacterium]|nr:hypothetical protein [Chloroflexota bacterium]
MLEFFAIALRGGLGFIFGLVLGIGGLIFALAVIPGLVPPIWTLVVLAGAGSGVAAFLSWFKPEANWKVKTIGFLLALAGGVAGAGLGFVYGQFFYPEGVRNVRFVAYGDLRSPAVFTYIVGATALSSLLGGLYYAFRLFRYNEV